MTIEQIKTKNILWLNVKKPGQKEMEFLADNFKYHHLDLKDCLPPIQRPKLFNREAYLFLTILFPVYNLKERNIFITEIDFFITATQLTMVHSNDLLPLNDLFKKYKNNPDSLQKLIGNNPGSLLYEILAGLLQSLFPMLTHISSDIDSIEKAIFNGQEKKMIQEISIVKRNIVNFRRATQSHKNIITKLINEGQHFFACDQLNIYFKNLIASTKDTWELIETYEDTINNLENTNNSLVSFRLNNIMKTLTIISVLLFPLTLIAGIFGMNIAGGMPFFNQQNGFWSIIIIMLVCTLIMLLVFKKKKWL